MRGYLASGDSEQVITGILNHKSRQTRQGARQHPCRMSKFKSSHADRRSALGMVRAKCSQSGDTESRLREGSVNITSASVSVHVHANDHDRGQNKLNGPLTSATLNIGPVSSAP